MVEESQEIIAAQNNSEEEQFARLTSDANLRKSRESKQSAAQQEFVQNATENFDSKGGAEDDG